MAGEPDKRVASGAKPSLDAFSKRLDAARSAHGGEDAARAMEDRAGEGRALGQGFRLASELLAAMIVGPALGWVVDWFAGTSPFGLLAGIFLGFAAGIRNVSRAMKAAEPDKTHDARPDNKPAIDKADT